MIYSNLGYHRAAARGLRRQLTSQSRPPLAAVRVAAAGSKARGGVAGRVCPRRRLLARPARASSGCDALTDRRHPAGNVSCRRTVLFPQSEAAQVPTSTQHSHCVRIPATHMGSWALGAKFTPQTGASQVPAASQHSVLVHSLLVRKAQESFQDEAQPACARIAMLRRIVALVLHAGGRTF